MTSRNFWKWVTAISVFCLVWRLAIIFFLNPQAEAELGGDPLFYHWAARLLAEGHGWINPFPYFNIQSVEQAADHPPLFTLFLSFWTWLGFTGVTSQMVIVSIFISTPTIILVALLGKELGGERLGVIAASVAAISPGVWSWDGLLLSEPLAALTVTTLVLLAYRLWHGPSLLRSLWMGVALAIAALSRSELLLLSITVVTPLILCVPQWSWKKRLSTLTAIAIVCASLLAPWVVFNFDRFDRPMFISSNFPITLAVSTCDSTFYGEFTGYWDFTCYTDSVEAEGLDYWAITTERREEIALETSFDYLRDHLTRVPTVVAIRWARIAGLWKPRQQTLVDSIVDGRLLWATSLAQGSSLFFSAAAIGGAVILRRRKETLIPILGSFAMVFLTVSIVLAQNRFRASVEPLIALLTAVAIDQLIQFVLRIRGELHAIPLEHDI